METPIGIDLLSLRRNIFFSIRLAPEKVYRIEAIGSSFSWNKQGIELYFKLN